MALQVRRPEDTIIQLTDGEWILVKKWLNAGESHEVFSRMVKSVKAGELDAAGNPTTDMNFDIAQMSGISKAVVYLLDWSAKDPDGKQIVIRDKSPREVESALKSLPLDAFKEISAAIDAHEQKMDAELAAKKNGLATESASSATSPSVAP